MDDLKVQTLILALRQAANGTRMNPLVVRPLLDAAANALAKMAQDLATERIKSEAWQALREEAVAANIANLDFFAKAMGDIIDSPKGEIQ